MRVQSAISSAVVSVTRSVTVAAGAFAPGHLGELTRIVPFELVDAVLESGVTQEFLLRRLGETQPRSLRLAVLLDKPEQRRVALEPDYFGFRTASNGLWVGYGLAASNGMGRNEKGLSVKPLAGKREGRKR